MLGLLTRKKQASTDPSVSAPASASPAVAETIIPPKTARRSSRHVAFAIDQTGIQMATSKRSSRRSKLLDIRKTYFPASLDGDPARNNFITRTIDEYLQRHGGRSAQVSISITGGETAFRTFNMPAIKGSGFSSAVAFEAKKQLPFPVQDCRFDYRPIYRNKIDGREGVRVALLAATRRLIDDQLSPFDQLNREVHQVYHAQDVVGTLLKDLPDFEEDRHYTLVNVERHRTEISYYRGTNLEFYHICSVGSSFLANRSDLTIFEYFAESLAGEIQNSLDFYSGHYSGQFTTRIYIYGDLSYTDELINQLHDHFGYEFRRFPTEDLNIGSTTTPDELDSLSVNLPALAAALNTTKLANLLPADRLTKIVRSHWNRVATLGVLVLASLLLVGWLAFKADLARTQAALDNVSHEVDSFKNSELYGTYNKLKQQIMARQAYLARTAPTSSYLAFNLKELSLITPKLVKFRSVDYRVDSPDRNMMIEGTIAPGPTPNEVVLAEFVENLSASPFYKHVTVIGYSKHAVASGQELEFQIGLKGTI